jgi:hypothetical protein
MSSLQTVAVVGGGCIVDLAQAPPRTMLAQDGSAQENVVLAGMDPAIYL